MVDEILRGQKASHVDLLLRLTVTIRKVLVANFADITLVTHHITLTFATPPVITVHVAFFNALHVTITS